jgi:small subunit ribosomal protein S17
MDSKMEEIKDQNTVGEAEETTTENPTQENAPDMSVKERVEEKTADSSKGRKKVLMGTVVSNKTDKTIVVSVIRQVAHPLYKKYYKQTNKFMAHDPNNDCNKGDKVRIKECRPLSARKRFELVEIIERAK